MDLQPGVSHPPQTSGEGFGISNEFSHVDSLPCVQSQAICQRKHPSITSNRGLHVYSGSLRGSIRPITV